MDVVNGPTARKVQRTGGSTFTDRHRSVLLSEASEARNGRESMRSLVGAERAAVERAADEIGAVECDLAEVTARTFEEASFETLESARTDVLALQDRCESGVERRQETITRLRRRTLEPVAATDYREFCDAALDVEYPVLSAYAAVLSRIDAQRRAVEREMAYAED